MAPAPVKKTILAAGLLVGLGGGAFTQTPWGQGVTAWLGLTAPPTVYQVPGLPSGTPELHILFIGNSYTFTNDLPGMLRAVAASDNITPVDVETGEVARGGALLEQTFEDPQAQRALASRHWDYVVLQEGSLMTMRPDLAARALHGFTEWGTAIRAAGATPVVLETWARQPGSPDYSNEIAATYHLTDAASMQADIDQVLGGITSTISGISVPAGDAWARCETASDAPGLYQPDGSHPSLAGTYLTALLLYHMLTGHAPINSVGFVPPGLSQDGARLLALCAAGWR
jgi:hypothetical protein